MAAMAKKVAGVEEARVAKAATAELRVREAAPEETAATAATAAAEALEEWQEARAEGA